ncbi:hypothetical protein HDV06_003300 [Boothiomyces sp. JEL0866]|nr:hypothetical protein HDV06_003300 [Boothiomyces sp. JEL0866]
MAVDYEKFITQLRTEEGTPLKAKFQNFLVQFEKEAKTLQLQRKLIAKFLAVIIEDSQNHLAFIDKEDQSFDEENVKEGWEKLVMAKVFDLVFGAPTTDEHRSNALLAKQIKTYAWLEERHLDLKINFSLSLEVAQAELLRINGYKAPRDKLIILHNVMQIIVDLIKKWGNNETSNNDSLLPTLILVIVRANPPNLISNIKYITRYRNAQEMEKGTNQYCMTNMMGALSFIYNMSYKSLTLSDKERAEWLANPNDRVGDTKGSDQNLNKFAATAKEEFAQFSTQVTDFFGSFIKEVKSTADELLSSNPTSPKDQVFTPKDQVFTPNSFGAPDLPSPTTRNDRTEREYIDRERYELDLAIAMSLSENQQKPPMFEESFDEEIELQKSKK